ncbi:hypothetical protein A0U91_15270 (plasmid) [Acetobacter persici]|uniref:Uncharacterized protein n=1 Tax=Acetobacter persici TaxID=1076596 RepID=A0A1U9LIT5_9PROT|nr:hypothetical protein A0U91_15270 [Acetobacter persici]
MIASDDNLNGLEKDYSIKDNNQRPKSSHKMDFRWLSKLNTRNNQAFFCSFPIRAYKQTLSHAPLLTTITP